METHVSLDLNIFSIVEEHRAGCANGSRDHIDEHIARLTRRSARERDEKKSGFLIDLVKHGFRYTPSHQMNGRKATSMSQPLPTVAAAQKEEQSSSKPNPTTENGAVPTRVAVCVSRQPRTLNMILPPQLKVMNVDPRVFGKSSLWKKLGLRNRTTADNIQSLLFNKLPAFDVFMYVSTKEKHQREPKVNDVTICESLRPRSSSNRLFCSVEKEVDITSPSINITALDTYGYGDSERMRQGLLQQLNGLLQCNAMRKEHSRKTGTRYTHWIRLRPDSAFLDYFPNIETMRFVDESTGQPIVTFADKRKCCCGNEDWFGVGRIETMDAYFDRINTLQAFRSTASWSAEDYATYALNASAHAQLTGNDPRVQVCIYKPPDRKAAGEP